jgi:serine kinase of HPr protein (carbohydrate metabolism regulator)
MAELQTMLVHATAVAVAGQAVLLCGPSGSGKSDLALRLVDEGARLVADDQTRLVRRDDGLWASAPEAIRDLLEVRGLGLVRLPALERARVALMVDLVPGAAVERLPEPEQAALLGLAVPRLRLDGASPSAPAKIRMALRQAGSGTEVVA